MPLSKELFQPRLHTPNVDVVWRPALSSLPVLTEELGLTVILNGGQEVKSVKGDNMWGGDVPSLRGGVWRRASFWSRDNWSVFWTIGYVFKVTRSNRGVARILHWRFGGHRSCSAEGARMEAPKGKGIGRGCPPPQPTRTFSGRKNSKVSTVKTQQDSKKRYRLTNFKLA